MSQTTPYTRLKKSRTRAKIREQAKVAGLIPIPPVDELYKKPNGEVWAWTFDNESGEGKWMRLTPAA
jgi:hypothetical protein